MFVAACWLMPVLLCLICMQLGPHSAFIHGLDLEISLDVLHRNVQDKRLSPHV